MSMRHSLSDSAPNAPQHRSTIICQRLFRVCYYYCRLLGLISYSIKRFDNVVNDNIRVHNNRYPPVTPANSSQFVSGTFAFRAYDQKWILWFNTTKTVICCCIFSYGTMVVWMVDDYLFAVIVHSQVITMVSCTLTLIIAQFWRRKRVIREINELLQLLQAIEEFHGSYAIFQWTHVALVAVKVIGFIVEMYCSLESITYAKTWLEFAEGMLEVYFMIFVWMVIHLITHIYICIDAMFGALNHYMRHNFVPRLRAIHIYGAIATINQVNSLQADMVKFINLYERVHKLGLKLHCQWQLPLAITILSVYFATLSITYYMIWQYFDAGILHTRYFPYLTKLILDIMMLSLTAHRAIRSSQLIGWMGLENAILVENESWHTEMEMFLCRLNLYNFKLSIFGLFDITNALLLTFISGILTSISIFLPFSIKTYRIQKFLEKQN